MYKVFELNNNAELILMKIDVTEKVMLPHFCVHFLDNKFHNLKEVVDKSIYAAVKLQMHNPVIHVIRPIIPGSYHIAMEEVRND